MLMHRPNEELDRITPGNLSAFNFRDVVYWKEFQREHDVFTDALRGEGVDVILLEALLDEGDAATAFKHPNLVFTRDVSAVNNQGAFTLRMTNQARYVEPLLVEKAMHRLGVPVALKVTPPGLVEGGDFVWFDEETVMMGFGTRSNETGLYMVKDKMLGDAVKEFVAVILPHFRVHLDGALMMLAPDLAVYHEASLGLFPSYVYTKEGMRIVFLSDYLKSKGVELIQADDSEVRVFGTNILGLGDRKCVSYEWNQRIIGVLEDYSFDVIGIPGSQLRIGGGGPHCLTCPIIREV